MFWKLCKAMKDNKKGFTLVELMVVVVIIGILVAIAIPIYNNTQNSASRNAVEANLRTIDGAIQSYKAANAGANPADMAALVPNYLAATPSGPGALASTDYTVDTNKRAAVTLPANAFGSTLAAGDYNLEELTW
ncbi:MAG: prepilin-type N-terminal cleavage/methylation domain-containing protein [Bacillota bacterium]